MPANEQVEQSTANQARRTIEMGRARQRLGGDAATSVIQLTGDGRGRERGEDLVARELSRRIASHDEGEETRSDGSLPDGDPDW